VTDKDECGNAIIGDVLTVDTRNSFLHSGSRLIATVGVSDLVVVETPDAVMVAPKDRVQEVKKIVDQLTEQNRSEAVIHRKVYRPWGFYDLVDDGERYHTKHIVVKPGARLSLQKHHHRAEHWIVVKGTALVTKGDEKILLTENESTYIPLGVVHCLENPGVIALEMVEVQSGSYLGEDDIVRFEDKYGRT
jgi:mannose-1-phosphate guanylyltransferase/mannose-1-phosphate guanylyltransferase/mannose-6-phosphate isomerase